MSAATEQVLTIAPAPCARIAGTTAAVMFARPNTLTPNTRVDASAVAARMSPTAPIPALLHSTSILPWAARASVAIAAQASASEMSWPRLRSTSITTSPLSRKRATIAVPIPPVAPVTMTMRGSLTVLLPGARGTGGRRATRSVDGEAGEYARERLVERRGSRGRARCRVGSWTWRRSTST